VSTLTSVIRGGGTIPEETVGGCPAPGGEVTTYIDTQLERFANEAAGFVQDAQDSLQSLLEYRGDLDTYQNPLVPMYLPQTPTAATATWPTLGTLNTTSPWSLQQSGMANVSLVDLLSDTSAPEFDVTSPTYTEPTPPTLLPLGALPEAPTLPERLMPEYAGTDLPVVPTLVELNIPDMPDYNIPTWDVTRPDFESQFPYLYPNNVYGDADSLRTAVRNALNTENTDGAAVRARWNQMLLGGTGLPIEVEQAIFDRGIVQEDNNSAQAINAAQTEWAARGFTLPGSTVLARVSEIRQTNRNARAALNREIVIQSHMQEIENLRFAVQQGVALEQQFTQQFAMTHDVALKQVELSYRVARDIVELQISMIRILVEVYQADIVAFRERVQAELSRLEAIRIELEAERLRGEINMQRIELYKAELQGALLAVEVFKAEIEAVNAQIRGDLAQVEIYRGKLEGYKTGLEAQKLQVDIYTAQLGGEKTKADIYSTQVQSYAERVRSFATETNAKVQRVEGQVAVRESTIRQNDQQIAIWKEYADRTFRTVDVQLREFTALFEQVRAEVTRQLENTRYRQGYDQLAQQAQFEYINNLMRNADRALEFLKANSQLEMEAMRASAQTASQLAASAMSAMSIGASISQSSGDSRSCSYSESLDVNMTV
jgi:hypothetical protein